MLFDDFHYVFVKEKFTAYFVIFVSYTVVGPSPDPDKEQQYPFRVSLKSQVVFGSSGNIPPYEIEFLSCSL